VAWVSAELAWHLCRGKQGVGAGWVSLHATRGRAKKPPMLIARTREELAQSLAALRADGAGVALVPTMGALHDGHLSLVAQARAVCGHACASIFVNPTQFAPHEDFSRYPRDEAGDLAKLRAAGCDLAWLPGVADIYPAGDATVIEVTGPAQGWEGDRRPGHFRGVATVVAKLCGLARPDAAVFGEKDWQQLQVIRRMVGDLLLPVRVIGAPVVRESDGLAMSSRNRYLTPGERSIAPVVHATLAGVRAALARGVAAGDALADGEAALAGHGFSVDYLALVDGPTLLETKVVTPAARLIVAAKLGAVRLLDNIAAT